jgi:hypothetical protein
VSVVNLRARLRLIERRLSRGGDQDGGTDDETRAALANLTDAELDALERAHATGIDDETHAILEKMERFRHQARAAK